MRTVFYYTRVYLEYPPTLHGGYLAYVYPLPASYTDPGR